MPHRPRLTVRLLCQHYDHTHAKIGNPIGCLSQEEVLIWARWGSVKLVKAQHRCIVTNPLGERPDVGLLARTISHDAFVSLVAPAFIPGMPDQDFMAICQRTFHVVFLRDRAYVRYPGEEKVPVKQIEYPVAWQICSSTPANPCWEHISKVMNLIPRA